MKALLESVTSTNNPNRYAATEIKENITSSLQHTVRQICATSSPEFGDDGTSDLCAIIEAIFLNGLKDGLMNRFRRNLGEMNPQYNLSFWNLLMEISHQENIKYVEKLRIIKTEVGQCRAWIRVALNEALLSSYLKTIRQNRRTALRYYYSYAYLLDAEALDIAQTMIQRVESMPLNLPCNSGILNNWSDAPLSLAGFACRPMRTNTVSTGIDIAQMIPATNSAAHSPSSQVSLNSGIGQIVNLNGDEALKLILKAHSNKEGSIAENTSESRFLPSDDGDVQSSLNVDHVQSNNLGCLIKDQSGWSCDSGEEGNKDNATASAGNEENESAKALERSYSSLIESNIILNNTQIRTPDFRNMLHSVMRDNDAPCSEDSVQEDDSFSDEIEDNGKAVVLECNDEKLVTNKKPEVSLGDFVTLICQERGLDQQDYKCKSCNQALQITSKPQCCAYSGLYFCDKCMSKEEISIPARMVHNWDFRKYPVSQESLEFVNRVKAEPTIDFKSANPYIYTAVDEMMTLQTIRNQLNYLRAYLYTCREPVIEELQRKMRPREYMYEHIHRYSVSDLLEVRDGSLAVKLQEVIDFGKNHVSNCWLCCQKGFVCELCDDSKPLFPFDTGIVFRCNDCSGVYHNTCLNAFKPCPRCTRKQKRDVPLLEATLE